MSHEDQHLQDLSLLHDILPEFGFLGPLNDVVLYAQDELTRGICLMIRKGSIPIWLPVITRCYLDIRVLLQDSVDHARIQAWEAGNHAETTINRYLEISKGLKSKKSFETLRSNIANFVKGFKRFIFDDFTFKTKGLLTELFGLPPPPESERNYLYSRQPILCGLIAYRMTLHSRSLGLELNLGWGTISYPAHLYNALRKKTNPINVWPLIEEVISIHGEYNLFVGRRPNTISECYKHIDLAVGGSASNLASNRRNINNVFSKGARRSLIDTYTLGAIFTNSWQRNDDANFVDVPKNTNLLRSYFEDRINPERFNQLSIYEVEKLLNRQAMEADRAVNPTSKSLGRKRQNTKCLTSLQLLEALRESMLAEMPKLHFNYYHMYEQSMKLLRALADELDADFVPILGPGYLRDDSELSDVAYYILCHAFSFNQAASVTGSAGSSGRSKMLRRNLPAGASILDKAGRVFEKFLKEQGQDA